MATFYIQLENKLLQISGDLTAENISKALGYVPVSPNVTNELSQRVDNITFDSLKDNPFLQDGSGELNIVDEAGNIIAKIDADGIHSVDFIAGNHKLTDKIDSSALNGYAKESWVTAEITKAATEGKVDLTGYATEEYVNNFNFYNIKDNPIVNNGDGKLLFVDENGYIGLQLEEDGLYVKDVIGDGHKLSDKADKSELSNYATKDEVSDLVDMSVVTELQGKVNTLVSGDTNMSVRDIAVDVLTETLVSETATEAYDTLAEMSAWIKSHPEDAAAMNEAIQKNASDITNTLTSAKSYTDETIADIDFYSIKNNPIVNSEDGTLTFVDESGYIGLKVTEDGLVVKDVVTPEHTLSNKADKSELPTKVSDLTNDSGFITLADVPEVEIPSLDEYVKSEDLPNFDEFAKTSDIPSLDGYATEQWVNNKNYATEYDLNNIDYSSINNVPVSEDETGELNIIDESGNVGMKISSEAVYAKDFISGEHKLTEKLDSNNLKTINNESLVGDGNIVVGNIVSEEDDSLTIDDVNTNTYVKYVAQTLTEAQKAQVRTNIGVGEGGGTNITEQTILDWGFTKNTGTYSKPSAGIPKTDLASTVQTSLGLADTSIQSTIFLSTVRSGTLNISANTMIHLISGLTGSTTIKITHQTVTSDAEWGVKFFINGTTVPSITFASSSTSYPIAWINNTAPSFETGYMYEVTFKQFNNKYLAVCGKFKI